MKTGPARKRDRRRLLALLALAAGLLVAAALVPFVLAEHERASYMGARVDDAPDTFERLATLGGEVRETSGLAVSRTQPGVLYTHNDSGDGPRFYGVDPSGRLLATWDVEGATATDWEGADLGPCPAARERSCLFFGDIGDNARVRDMLTVWIVEEPLLEAEAGSGPRAVRPLGRLRYRYPDQPHDAEALAVSAGGDLVIVTKGRTPTVALHRLPAADLRAAVEADTVITLPPGRVLPIRPDFRIGRAVTGASFGPSGRVLAVRTYTEIYVLPEPLPDGPIPDLPSCWLGELEEQGEAVAFEDQATLLLTSEAARGEPAVLTRVRCDVVRTGA